MKIISLQEAKQAGITRYYTGNPCKYGHIAERITSNRRCIACANEASSKWKKAHLEQQASAKRAWVAKNKERVSAIKKAWNAANPEGQKARSRRWYLANKEKANQQHYEWAGRNVGAVTAFAGKRRASKLQRTPSWANLDEIKEIYQEAAEFRAHGIEVDVDHVIPLQGERVSGLHVASNLRICMSFANKSKSNHYSV